MPVSNVHHEVFTTMINAYAESGDVEGARVRVSENFTMLNDSPLDAFAILVSPEVSNESWGKDG